MGIREQRGKVRGKHKITRRHTHIYSYSVSGMTPGLRLGVKSISLSYVLALLVFLAMVALLIWFFVDTRFFVYEAEVQGNTLVEADEVYRFSGLDTMSIFYVDPARAAELICHRIPAIAQVRVNCRLPNRVLIHVREKDVCFVWRTMNTAFLVDREGLVLKADEGGHEGLISIRDLDDRPLQPGSHVDRVALEAVSRLQSLLPEVRTFEYSRAKGVSVLDPRGLRIYFGDEQAMAEKVASMRAVLQKLASSGVSAKFIDLRFVGSPYYE